MEMREITFLLADKQAKDTILNVCAVEVENGFIWRDSTKLSNCLSVLWEMKYLQMRGLLQHHTTRPHLIKLKGHDEAKPGTAHYPSPPTKK